MYKKNLKPRGFDEDLFTYTMVVIKEAKELLASFSLEFKNILSSTKIDTNIKMGGNEVFKEQSALYRTEVNLFQVQEVIQAQFIELLKTEFTSHAKYPNQINDFVEYINTKLKPNQHEVCVLINECRYLHALLDDSDFNNKNEMMNKLISNNIEVQKLSKMNLEDDLIQLIKANSTSANNINKSLDALYAENNPEINHLKISELIKERSIVANKSETNLELLKEAQHKEPIQKNSLHEFNFWNSLRFVELPLLARTAELVCILNKIQTVVEDILITKN